MYCLDTDTLSATIKQSPALELIRKLASVPPDAQFTTAINAGELIYGAVKAGRPDIAKRIRDTVLPTVTVLPFDLHAAEAYAPLRAELERQGKPLHEADLRIASIALANDLTVVTGNTRHFERISDLKVENWLAG